MSVVDRADAERARRDLRTSAARPLKIGRRKLLLGALGSAALRSATLGSATLGSATLGLPALSRANDTPDLIEFSDWEGPAAPVALHRPSGAGADAPLVFVMHGLARGGVGHRNAWRRAANTYGLVIAAPVFSKDAFPGADGYQIGAPNDLGISSHRLIEPLFDALRARLGLTAERYHMYGHSAGSQFTHRFLFRTGGPRLAAAVCANAGWYMMPDPEVAFPYGLRDAGSAGDAVETALGRRVTVLLGAADTKRDGSLRQTAQAEAQGANRVERGERFYQLAGALALARGAAFNWRLAYAPNVGHSNAEMSPFAAAALAGAF